MHWCNTVKLRFGVGLASLIAGVSLFALTAFEVTRPGWELRGPNDWEYAYEPSFGLMGVGFLLLVTGKGAEDSRKNK